MFCIIVIVIKINRTVTVEPSDVKIRIRVFVNGFIATNKVYIITNDNIARTYNKVITTTNGIVLAKNNIVFAVNINLIITDTMMIELAGYKLNCTARDAVYRLCIHYAYEQTVESCNNKLIELGQKPLTNLHD